MSERLFQGKFLRFTVELYLAVNHSSYIAKEEEDYVMRYFAGFVKTPQF